MKIGLIAILILFSLKSHSQNCEPDKSANLKTGDTVYFYCIEAKSSNGEVFTLQPMSYKIN